ncbi:MAG: hypothetical protein JXA20_12165 [Spirochaetes bacterium]|nr:hypothetical protein [Spirochaetota bacterium]
MKRSLFVITLFLVLAAAASIPCRARAMQLGVGPAVWYAGWNPVSEDFTAGSSITNWALFKASITQVRKHYSMNPAFLYGPSLILSWDRWSLSAIFVTGRYRVQAGSIYYAPATSVISPSDSSQDIYKYDLDTTIGYRLTEILKLFTGVKYQRYTLKKRGMMEAGSLMIEKVDAVLDSAGVGFGVAVTYQVHGNFYLLWNVSALAMVSFVSYDSQYSIPDLSIFWPYKRTARVPGFGGNSTLSLAYYIEPASTTVSLGVRYQYIRYFPRAGWGIEGLFNNKQDQFYGIMVSAIYTFNL